MKIPNSTVPISAREYFALRIDNISIMKIIIALMPDTSAKSFGVTMDKSLTA